MSKTIKVSASEVEAAVSSLKTLKEDLSDDAKALGRANDALCSAWSGDGSSSFKTGGETLREYLSASSSAMEAEAASLAHASETYSDQDQSLARALSGSGR